MNQIFEQSEIKKLRVVKCEDARLVRDCINAWHSFRKAPRSNWNIAFILTDGLRIYGVSIFSHPIARNEDQTTTLEHSRMALAPNAPRNSASFFMAGCRKWIRDNIPHIKRLISYVPSEHYSGVTYRADNWKVVYKNKIETATWATRRKNNFGCRVRTKFERCP